MFKQYATVTVSMMIIIILEMLAIKLAINRVLSCCTFFQAFITFSQFAQAKIKLEKD